ncbi:hypothetical protein [Clostridium botulinum]|uniref:hypothetical protein n=1 Tax=Clostridium botulinum TaxID=1491 RepID=UPI00069A85F9|nr:hypothetical protein [Clostridium botulinum]KOA78103.1 hypothetical protein ADU78_02200 [Clostridium botulinum]MCD3276177.1 hypothetical protein [Clostridium botulinum C/D]MCD3287925.1 hypothetical protein [Clostridium botulinum C/D]MCD3290029.1 hypothetical protein [Clostridium botulinum C/D]MCD3304015.1 hypothetical protein [Clostridium botulinum C/D]
MIIKKHYSDNEEIKLQQNISHICNCEYRYFLNKANVVGIGCGYKVKKGFYTNQLCVQVFVSRKISSNELNSNDIIPLIYKGIPTDVKETGYFTTCSLTQRVRPVLGGYSISTSMDERIYGTAGCLVTNGVSKFVLSNNHVIANANMLPINSPITQPALKHGGHTSNDTIATLHKYMPLRFINGQQEPTNYTDCALGLLTKSNIMSSEIALIGKPICVKNPKLNTHVRKVGAISGLTEGDIISVDATFRSNYPNNKRCLFKDQIITTPMAQNGDSGAILVDSNRCAVGLLFVTNTNLTAFNRLSTVLDQLDVHLPK